jgi:hypothetical protein
LFTAPNEASRKGLGLLNFEVTSKFDYDDGILVGTYHITFSAEEIAQGYALKAMPLFTAVRSLTFRWDGKELVFDGSRSNIDPNEVVRIVSGNYAHIYTMFRTDFDKLAKADGVKKQWFNDFLSVVRDEGLSVAMPGAVSVPVGAQASRSR